MDLDLLVDFRRDAALSEPLPLSEQEVLWVLGKRIKDKSQRAHFLQLARLYQVGHTPNISHRYHPSYLFLHITDHSYLKLFALF